MKRKQQVIYQSYLLRMWKENREGEWRMSLQDVTTSERFHFANLAALVEFLQVHTECLPCEEYPQSKTLH